MFDINFPIFAKGAVVREGAENEENLPDVWRFLSGNLIEQMVNLMKRIFVLFCRKK